jgi:hypothetical protein
LTGNAAAMAGVTPGSPSAPQFCGGGGNLAQLFIDDVMNTLVCDDSQPSYYVLPPYFQITPVVVESGDGCTQVPIPPATVPLSAVMGEPP